MRWVFLFMLSLAICPLTQWLAPVAAPTPTPAVPSAPNPHVEISASATTLHVGDTITLTGRQVNIGMPIFTLALNAQTVARINSMDKQPATISPDPHFEVVAVEADLNQVVFTLRALAPGDVAAVINASGEIRARSPQGDVFMWGGGGSETLHLTIQP